MHRHKYTETCSFPITSPRFIQIIGSAISLYCISPTLATLAGLVIPTIIAGGTLFGSLLRQFSRQAQAQLSVSTGIAYEAISNIRTTRAFGAEAKEHE